MKKINCIGLVVLAFSVSAACFQKAPASNMQPATSPSTVNASPIAEKSAAPANSTVVKTGDYNAALAFYNAKNYDKAAAEFAAVVEKDGKNQRAHLYLGKSLQQLKKSDEAVGAYKKAIELKPDDSEANYELGSLYMNKKDFETSLPFIQKAAKIKYTDPAYLIALGDNYRELDRCNYAMPPYGNATGFDDKNPAAYYGMGLCYIELKNRLAAAQQVRNLEKLDKNLAKKLADQIPK